MKLQCPTCQTIITYTKKDHITVPTIGPGGPGSVYTETHILCTECTEEIIVGEEEVNAASHFGPGTKCLDTIRNATNLLSDELRELTVEDQRKFLPDIHDAMESLQRIKDQILDLGYLVWVQEWEESERGWGCRPDGCSIHMTQEDAQAYQKAYIDSLPSHVLDSYERVVGVPVSMRIGYDLHQKVTQSENGVRLFRREYLKLKEANDLRHKA